LPLAADREKSEAMKALHLFGLSTVLFASLGLSRSSFAQSTPPAPGGSKQICTIRHTLVTLGFNIIEVYALYVNQGLIRNYMIDDYQTEGRSKDDALNAAFAKAEHDAQTLQEQGICFYLK
jgi:hypothetical protein